MPTYDAEQAERIRRQLDDCGFPMSTPSRKVAAEVLLAAFQEVERLTRERDEARELHALKHKWATEFGGEAQEYAALADMRADEVERLRNLIRDAAYVAERTGALTDSDREDLAAIRRAAGVEGEGEGE